jgi:hypothetical protein
MQPASNTKSPTSPRNAVGSILREQKIGAVDVWGNFSRRDDGTNVPCGVPPESGLAIKSIPPLIARLRGCRAALHGGNFLMTCAGKLKRTSQGCQALMLNTYAEIKVGEKEWQEVAVWMPVRPRRRRNRTFIQFEEEDENEDEENFWGRVSPRVASGAGGLC